MSEKSEYWIEIAEYDVETAKQCLFRNVFCMSASCAIKR